MSYTLGQAAKATGKSKTTIQRAITKGRISAKKTEVGAYSIDPSELHRVFPLISNETVSATPHRNDTRPPEEHPETVILKAENEMLRSQLDDMRDQRNKWERQATALLPAPSKKRGWWPW